jgi:outer membrane receptor protein involved in Fe transport
MHFSQSLFSQGYQNGNFQGTMPMDANITGTIIDSITGQPVEYAIVAIHRMKDSILVTGNSTKTNGSFSVEGLPYGRFYAEISFVGYKKHIVRSILLTPKNKTVNIGTIKIEPSSTDINAVVVTGNKPAIEYKLDKKVIDVTQNVVAAGGTVVDALQNIPSIQSDIQGNVTLRGSSNFTVLIDGRPSPLTGSEALQQIPASLVQNVEIITNPSAKYDSEGSAGIINVVMKKQNVRGMNGIVNITAGTHEKYSANLNINYKVSKFNFSLGGDFTDMKYLMSNYFNNEDTLFKKHLIENQVIQGNGNFHRQGKGLKAGIDYYIDNKNTLSLGANIGSRNFNRSFNSFYDDKYTNDTSFLTNHFYYRNNTSGISDRQYFNTNLDYQLKLNDKGHKLSASLFYSSGPDNSISDLMQDTTIDRSGQIEDTSKNSLVIHTEQKSNENEFRTNIDYSYPFSEKGKLEAGYQGRYNNNNGTYKVDSSSIEILKLRDKIDFQDQIHSAYVTYSNSFVLFDYQLGLRADYERRTFDQQIKNKLYVFDSLVFFPTIHLSKQLPWDLQLQASYSKRIDRPRDWNLDPVAIYVDPQTVRIGNANLRPQFTDSYELNLEKKLNEASFVSAEGFYRRTNNLIQQFTANDSLNHKTITFTNIDHDRSIGAEFMLNLVPVKWLIFNSSWSIFNYRMYGRSNPSTPNSTNTWNLRINPTVKLKWGTAIQLNYVYNAPTITGQGTRSGFYNSSIGIRQELFKRKGSLTVQIQNPVGKTKFISTTKGTNLYSYNWFQRELRVFMFTFSYRINNYKVQKTKTQDDNNAAPDTEMMGGQ